MTGVVLRDIQWLHKLWVAVTKICRETLEVNFACIVTLLMSLSSEKVNFAMIYTLGTKHESNVYMYRVQWRINSIQQFHFVFVLSSKCFKSVSWLTPSLRSQAFSYWSLWWNSCTWGTLCGRWQPHPLPSFRWVSLCSREITHLVILNCHYALAYNAEEILSNLCIFRIC